MNQTLLLIEHYFLWIIIYSFIGWCYESILCSIQEKRWINRGFLNGPYCPIYGLCSFFMITILHKVESIILILFLSMFIASLTEYITSWLLEKLFHARWWDYSQFKFHIHGRICLLASLVFGSFAVLLLRFLHPLLLKYLNKIPIKTIHLLFLSFFFLFIFDCIYTIARFSSFHKKLQKLSEEVAELKDIALQKASKYKDSVKNKLIESVLYDKIFQTYDAFYNRINFQERRMLSSFPSLQSTTYDKVLQEFKSFIGKIKRLRNKKR